MYEDRTIENRYLHNFSPEETAALYRLKRARDRAKADRKFIGYAEAKPSANTTSLELKYVLNRIAANDPRDTTLELDSTDMTWAGDWWALHMAKAFFFKYRM